MGLRVLAGAGADIDTGIANGRLIFGIFAVLFYDLSTEKEVKIPTQGEKRELRKLVVRSGKPVALFIDEAHDLHGRTLNGLKRLMEVVGRGGGNLSVVLIGHPKLRNDLRRDGRNRLPH